MTNPKIFLKVTYFTLIVFILETVFFHVFNYIHDYFQAVLIISYVVLGVGLGAFVAAKIKLSEKYLFLFCSFGFLVSLYLAIVKTVFWASPGISNLILFLVFLFPSVYITTIYTEQKSNTVYLFDLVGCFLGVLAVFLLYEFFISEAIFFLILLVLPVIILNEIFYQDITHKNIFIFVSLLFIITGAVLYYNQVKYDKYNLFGLVNCQNVEKSPEKTRKVFCRKVKRVKTYDNLIDRIDVTSFYDSKKKPIYNVFFNGWGNDQFDAKIISTENDYLKYKEKKWPILDIRVLYGAAKTPSILAIGSAADGAVKTFKRITPCEKITTVEINPAILKMMQKDFFEESGRAYSGLNPILANGVSFLKASDEKFDIITLLNTHPYRNLGHQGAPDYLHTTESYNLFLDHLTDSGYIMFEERPESPNAKLALYRQINTLWQTLKDRGVENPSAHFVIWSWDAGGEYEKYSLYYYVSILVSKNPINTDLIGPWIKEWTLRKSKFLKLEYSFNYLGKLEGAEFVKLFRMIESGDFNQLAGENFDSSIATNNRPFLSQAIVKNEKLDKLILNIGILTFGLWIIFTGFLLKGGKIKEKITINIYNVLIGFAFFFIEIILFQAYQNIFLSSTSSFVLVLGFLLFFAGIGGYLSEKTFFKKIFPTSLFLMPISLGALYLPDYFLKVGLLPVFSRIVGLILISATGFFIGFYFPRGLLFAKKFGLRDKTYYFFAINAISGCFSVVLALYLGIKIGYIYTIILALLFYLLADIILLFLNRYASIIKE